MNDPSKEYQKLIKENASLKQRIRKLEKSAESGKTGTNTRQSDRKFEAIFQCSPDVITITDLTSGLLLDVNDSFLSLGGYSREEVIGSTTKELNIWDNMEEKDRIFDLIKTGTAVDKVELTFRAKTGESRQMLFSARLIEVDGRQLLIADTHDITDRKKAEKELIRVNRALRILSDTNHALIHIMDEATLLNEVCRIIVDVGGYRMAFVGFAEHDEAKTILPVAHAGFESGYIESINVTWADNERGRGPGGTAIRTGKPSIAHNIPQDPAFAPWREAAIERGYKSNIALPLISEGQPFGELSIYSADTDAFDSREVEILKELADNLAFGIASLRKRVKGEQAEVALRESEERYRLIVENTADTIAVFDLSLNPTYISPSALNLRGYTAREAMTQTWNEMLTPDSLERATNMFADQMALESSGTADLARTALIELEEYCKDGSTIWVELATSFLRDNHFKPIGILTVTRNITARKQAELELQKTLERLRKSIGVTIQVMVSAIEVRDPYTAGHQKRVADLARSIATVMGLNKDKIEGIRTAGSIHDIGKLAIPSEILTKPTKLTDLEFSLIKEHPESGYEMLKNVESPWPLAQIVYQHHERMNGSGYPRKLKGEEIIIEARIMAVADVVEAMASHRPYRPGLGLDAALEEIEKNKGIIYDADVVDACLRLFREKGYKLT
ncbi:MAG: Cyclic di-GMP phosphodiesterase response regulator RpfG [Deltaproteobacteria bacterium ADurb.Bin151]|nr:MAG: Cyclic di-GMP phosphodiesterase response regulator RpfG [Deltaproteobacteria bacterium ADurb.Bin151]